MDNGEIENDDPRQLEVFRPSTMLKLLRCEDPREVSQSYRIFEQAATIRRSQGSSLDVNGEDRVKRDDDDGNGKEKRLPKKMSLAEMMPPYQVETERLKFATLEEEQQYLMWHRSDVRYVFPEHSWNILKLTRVQGVRQGHPDEDNIVQSAQRCRS
jgi:hypothetical protein